MHVFLVVSLLKRKSQINSGSAGVSEALLYVNKELVYQQGVGNQVGRLN